jgi:hypothetical protein
VKGFILAHGRSGTMWVASALRACTDLDARHESMGHDFGPDFGGVESNGNFWARAREIPELYPGAVVIHQVRDGRDVVRSVMTRKQRTGRTLEQACIRWVRRNEQLAADLRYLFKLEKLLSCWDAIRGRVVNGSPAHTFPAYEDWTFQEQYLFWQICGPTMEKMGYGARREQFR